MNFPDEPVEVKAFQGQPLGFCAAGCIGIFEFKAKVLATEISRDSQGEGEDVGPGGRRTNF